MHPEQIKAAIRMKGTTPAAIADELKVSRTTVSQVIHNKGTSKRVRTKIASIIGLPSATIWPPEPSLRRTSKKQQAGARA